MLDFVWGILSFVARALDFVLQGWVTMSRLRRFGRIAVTGRLDDGEEIKVPRDPLPPAAERALAEAEERRHKGAA